MVEYVFIGNNQMVALGLGSTLTYSTAVLFLMVVIRFLSAFALFTS